MKIIANKSILHNNITGCTFIASELDEEVQSGTRSNDSHIEWMGDLDILCRSQSQIEKLEKENQELKEALDDITDKYPNLDIYESHERAISIASEALKK